MCAQVCSQSNDASLQVLKSADQLPVDDNTGPDELAISVRTDKVKDVFAHICAIGGKCLLIRSALNATDPAEFMSMEHQPPSHGTLEPRSFRVTCSFTDRRRAILTLMEDTSGGFTIRSWRLATSTAMSFWVFQESMTTARIISMQVALHNIGLRLPPIHQRRSIFSRIPGRMRVVCWPLNPQSRPPAAMWHYGLKRT